MSIAAVAPSDMREFGRFRILRLRQPVLRRVSQLLPGLYLFGLALALMVEANYGANPWTVFSEGAAQRLGLTIGTVVVLIGLALLVFFAVFTEPLGLGTVLNVIVIGPAVDLSLALIPELHSTVWRVAAIAVGPPLLGLASGLYIGAGLGPGPRDGLMTALARRGLSVSTARLLVEVTALVIGWLLGGTAGLGTLYFALTIGFWVRLFLPPLQVTGSERTHSQAPM